MFARDNSGRPVLFSIKEESFYAIPPQRFFNEIDGFKTSSRPYLLKYGAP